MSSFGSQARAAELAAAAAARQRLTNREREEKEGIPPKATPVSLGAFTKPPPATRNKGQKAWKPLSFEDFETQPTSTDYTPADTGPATPNLPAKLPSVDKVANAINGERLASKLRIEQALNSAAARNPLLAAHNVGTLLPLYESQPHPPQVQHSQHDGIPLDHDYGYFSSNASPHHCGKYSTSIMIVNVLNLRFVRSTSRGVLASSHSEIW